MHRYQGCLQRPPLPATWRSQADESGALTFLLNPIFQRPFVRHPGMLLVMAVCLWLILPARAATVVIVNQDGANEGLNDPTPVAPIGGNPGITIGEQRRLVLQRAAEIWGARLLSAVTIRVGANFDSLSCNPNSGTLGSAGPRTFFKDFVGAPQASTWYAVALANALAGTDLDPFAVDIDARFNSDVGTAGCLSSGSWYHGLDGATPAGMFNLLNTVLHEMAHGLGFLSTVDLATGTRMNGLSDTYVRNLEDHRTGKLYPAMSDAERLTASTGAGQLHWVGTNVLAARSLLTLGASSGHVEMYAPNPAESGSSVSHWSTGLWPDESMEPFANSNSDRRLTMELMRDIGWKVTSAVPTIVHAGSVITAESCLPHNGAIDPGETVTLDVTLRNTGAAATTNLVVTLAPPAA